MGGEVAMALALERPKCVGRLLVAGIAPVEFRREGRACLRVYIDAMAVSDPVGMERRADADRAWRTRCRTGLYADFSCRI
jgi:pimeloyl-ACP methyl ester carboxylesterase